MDFTLLGWTVIAVAFAPWTTEVFLQLRLQTLLLGILPPSQRAALPPHPVDPRLWALSSPRFQRALWRHERRELPSDSEQLLSLKRRLRASLCRQLVWVGTFATTVAVLLGNHWHP